MLRAFIAVIFLGLWPVSMLAQDVAYVQVEAHPTLTTAQARARFYAGQLENVNGFSLGGGWYGVVLGPYTPNDANTVLRQMRRDRTIPSDSFIIKGRRFQQQFWPVGVGAQTPAQPLPDATTPEVETVAPIEVAPLAEVSAPVVIPTETRRQAQASEKLLDRDQRKNLQTALKWAGFYASAIDGAYGRGTRASMRAWQNANNAEPTGVLTTTQRATLLASYNAVLDGMGLTLVRDDASGIEMLVPTGVVAFSEYEPPFVRFDPKGNLDASVLFISQDGDQNRLFGLYEILQTLTIVPNDGPRKRDNRSFELEGIDDDIHSYTYAKLDNGTIKGFSLIWPAGDDERRRRVLDEMKASFVVLDGVLDPSLAAPEAVGSCDRISLNSEHDAQVVHLDDALGLAVLRPDVALSPLGVVTFQTGIPRLQTSVAVAGFPYGGVLVTPSLTFGRLADMRGLNGEETIKRLALTAQFGDAGGPVFDNAGSVLGMLLPRNESGGQVLPQDVSFSVDSDEILASLNTAGIAAQTTDAVAFMSPETLTLRAADNTVLVSCW